MEKNIDLSRRSFLKSSGALVAGGAVLGGIGSTIVAPGTAHAAPGYLPSPRSIDPLNMIDPDLVRKLTWYHNQKSGG
jgi:hypothetical protein